MKGLLATIWSELAGLFVDDGALALLSVVWITLVGAAVWAIRPEGLLSGLFAGAFFFGLAAILLESVLREARKRRQNRQTKST
jgi:hypothetical protein